MQYLLDTNVLIAAMKGQMAVRRRLESLPLTALRLSAVVFGELCCGAEKSRYGESNRARLETLRQQLPWLGVDEETGRHYGRIRALLEGAGTPIGANDLWIAAQALAAGCVLVTDNEREFSQVTGLPLENWLHG